MKLLVALFVLTSALVNASTKNCAITSYGKHRLAGYSGYSFAVMNSTYDYQDANSGIHIIRDGFLTDVEFSGYYFTYDSITSSEENDNSLIIKFNHEQEKANLILKYYKDSEKGVLLGKKKSEDKFFVLATFDCANYSNLEEEVENTDIRNLDEIDFKDLPKNVRAAMRDVDLPFEYGDGYYDILWEKIYLVKSNEEVIGYIVETKMNYTEDDEDVYNTDYFYPNGIRFKLGFQD